MTLYLFLWFAPDQRAFIKKYSMHHVFYPNQITHMMAVAQLRMGAHWLSIELLRMAKGVHTARSKRTCACCQCDIHDDEMHMFECA